MGLAPGYSPGSPGPESAPAQGDVYALGLVLLELLTGRYLGSELPNSGVVVELLRWV